MLFSKRFQMITRDAKRYFRTRKGPAVVALFLFAFFPIVGEANPVLRGNVSIELTKGEIKATNCLGQLPDAERYTFSLNKSLTVSKVQVNGKQITPTLSEGEYNKEYSFSAGGRASKICADYQGRFEVYREQTNPQDFKGNINFNSTSIRAAEQSRWYPVLMHDDVPFEKMEFEITVECEGCSTIYVNGDVPKSGPRNRFKSKRPAAPLLYAGKFGFLRTRKTFYVGDGFTEPIVKDLDQWSREAGKFFGKLLSRTINDEPFFMVFEASTEKRDWAFSVLPTVAFTRYALKQAEISKNEKKEGVGYEQNFSKFLAHELGHFYFGGLVEPIGKQFWFLLESTAEFLALKFTQFRFGDDVLKHYAERFREKWHEHKDESVPILGVNDSNEINSFTRYGTGAWLLMGLEERFGQDKAQLALRNLFEGRSTKVMDFSDFRASWLKTGITAEQWADYSRECFEKIPDGKCHPVFRMKD